MDWGADNFCPLRVRCKKAQRQTIGGRNKGHRAGQEDDGKYQQRKLVSHYRLFCPAGLNDVALNKREDDCLARKREVSLNEEAQPPGQASLVFPQFSPISCAHLHVQKRQISGFLESCAFKGRMLLKGHGLPRGDASRVKKPRKLPIFNYRDRGRRC